MNQAKRWTMYGKVNDTFTRIVVRPASGRAMMRIQDLQKSASDPIVKVDWGDGHVSRFTADQTVVTHSYQVTGGTFTIKINRGLSALKIYNNNNASDNDDHIAIEEVSSPFDITVMSGFLYERGAVLTDSTVATLKKVSFKNVKHLTHNETSNNLGYFSYQRELVELNFDHLEDVNPYKNGAGAFQGCSKLPSVSMPCLGEIVQWMFAGCTLLSTISFPKVTKVCDFGMNATGITSLTDAQFPLLAEIGKFAFGYNMSLASISLSSIACIGQNASTPEDWYWAGIDSRAFVGCSALTSLSLPNCKRLSVEAFKDCSSLSSVSLPLLKLLGQGAFTGCSALTTLSLPEVTRIGTDAFTGCTNMTTLRIPKAQYIEGWVFADQGAIEDIAEEVELTEYDRLMDEWDDDATTQLLFHQEYVLYYHGCNNLTDVYIDNMTVNEILNITNGPDSSVKSFPFGAPGGVKFHGSDGYILSNKDVVYNS